MKTTRCVFQDANIELHEYVPSFFQPLYCNFEPMRIVRRLRLWGEYFRKGSYLVYYLMIGKIAVGYCVVTPGGRRLKCSTSSDIVIGPYFIEPSFRGKGYSKLLISLTLKYCRYFYDYAYDWIDKNNIASIHATESCGFEKCGALNVSSLLRRLTIVENGDDYIYRYKKQWNKL